MNFSLVEASRGYSLVEVHGLLIVVASFVEHSPWGISASVVAACRLYSIGSVVVKCKICCPVTYGIFPD